MIRVIYKMSTEGITYLPLLGCRMCLFGAMKYPHGIYTEPSINELLLKDQIIEKDAPRLTQAK